MDMPEVAIQISTRGTESFTSELREKFLGRRVNIRGRSFVDDQGAMVIVDEIENSTSSTEELANEVLARWGVTL
jgi:DNA primase large subunit